MRKMWMRVRIVGLGIFVARGVSAQQEARNAEAIRRAIAAQRDVHAGSTALTRVGPGGAVTPPAPAPSVAPERALAERRAELRALHRALIELRARIGAPVAPAATVAPVPNVATVTQVQAIDPAYPRALAKVATDESMNQSSRIPQDALVSVTLPRGASVDVGQFTLPLAYEGPTPTSRVVKGLTPFLAGHNAKVQLNAVNRRWSHARFDAVRQLLLNAQTSW